jgi:hypothetical protein
MPTEVSKKNGNPYLAARERVENQVAHFAGARKIEVIVEIQTGDAPSNEVVHQIRLTYGRASRLVAVDHETFMDEEFFRTLVVHQLEDAIDQRPAGFRALFVGEILQRGALFADSRTAAASVT